MNMELAAGKYTRQHFEGLSIKELVALLIRWSDKYHNGVSKISDATFDLGEKVLRERSPKNKFFAKVGAPVKKGSKKVKLPIALGSLSKMKPSDGIEGWLAKAGDTITVSDKLDGVSALNKDHEAENKMYTRGNSTVGQDISALIPVVSGVGKLRKNEAVRGELVMPRKKFKGNFSKLFENTRNVVAGVANSNDKAGHIAASSLVFVAYEMLQPNKPLSAAAPYLAKRGFKVVKYKVFNKPTVQQLMDYFELRKKKSLFDLDGLVLHSAKAGTVAFKVETEVAKTKVKEIQWNLTKYGTWAPKIILVPVRLSGVTVKQATAYNARYLFEMGIGPGAVVNVTRSGDVIPKIVSVIKKAKPTVPDGPHEFNKSKVDFVLPKGEAEPEKVLVERVSSGIAILDVPKVRTGLVTKLVAGGYDTLVKVMLAKKSDLMEAGLGAKQAQDLYTDLRAARNKVQHPVMMKASGLWPKGFGVDRFEKILHKVSFQKISTTSTTILASKIAVIPGYSEKSAKVFVKYLPKYMKFIGRIKFNPAPIKADKNDALKNVNIAFTGFRDKSLADILKSRGAKINSSVGKATNILLIPAKSHKSVKTDKADKVGAKTMDLESFLKKYKVYT